MLNTIALLSRRSVHQLRHVHRCAINRTEAAAVASQSQPTPPPLDSDISVSPKIDKIASDITALNLIEVAQLSELLKKRLNLPDAPVMPMGGFMGFPKAEEEEDEAPKQVKSSFTVKLTGFEDKQKVALIKEMKTILPNTNLVQAKKFVESVPVVVKADISQADADALKSTIEAVGGKVEIV